MNQIHFWVNKHVKQHAPHQGVIQGQCQGHGHNVINIMSYESDPPWTLHLLQAKSDHRDYSFGHTVTNRSTDQNKWAHCHSIWAHKNWKTGSYKIQLQVWHLLTYMYFQQIQFASNTLPHNDTYSPFFVIKKSLMTNIMYIL